MSDKDNGGNDNAEGDRDGHQEEDQSGDNKDNKGGGDLEEEEEGNEGSKEDEEDEEYKEDEEDGEDEEDEEVEDQEERKEYYNESVPYSYLKGRHHSKRINGEMASTIHQAQHRPNQHLTTKLRRCWRVSCLFLRHSRWDLLKKKEWFVQLLNDEIEAATVNVFIPK